MAHTQETGPYPTKNSSDIDRVPHNQISKLKTFKNAAHTHVEWLTKKRPVRQQTDPAYPGFKGKDV